MRLFWLKTATKPKREKRRTCEALQYPQQQLAFCFPTLQEPNTNETAIDTAKQQNNQHVRARSKMLVQHLYESALYGDYGRNVHKSRHVEDEVSLLSTSSAAPADSNIGSTSNDEGPLLFLGNGIINTKNRRTSTRFVVGVSLGLILALAIFLDVAERYVHVSNFRRHGMTIPSASLKNRRRSDQKPKHLFRGQRKRVKLQI